VDRAEDALVKNAHDSSETQPGSCRNCGQCRCGERDATSRESDPAFRAVHGAVSSPASLVATPKVNAAVLSLHAVGDVG
jgi:hypothetical protein